MDIVALIELLVNGLIEAEESFLSNPRDLYSLEKATKATTDAVAAQFISEVLSSMDKAIYDSSIRKDRYNAGTGQKTSNTAIQEKGNQEWWICLSPAGNAGVRKA